jgi:hypothetical protein
MKSETEKNLLIKAERKKQCFGSGFNQVTGSVRNLDPEQQKRPTKKEKS